jgi:hypothetical protein
MFSLLFGHPVFQNYSRTLRINDKYIFSGVYSFQIIKFILISGNKNYDNGSKIDDQVTKDNFQETKS